MNGVVDMIFVPFLIYFFIVLLVSALLIPVYHDFHGAVFAAYYLSLLGGYIFYFAGMRIAIRRYLNNQVYFKLIYHLPYYGFLLPALVVSGPVIQYFIGNSIALFFAYVQISAATSSSHTTTSVFTLVSVKN